MIGFDIQDNGHIIRAVPHGKITETDIADRIGPQVDELLRRKGRLNGVLVDARDFEGWADFAAFAAHVKFIRDHHEMVDRIAIVNSGENRDFLTRLFDMVPDISFRFFSEKEENKARRWLES
jgi:hypothetical protein